MFASSRRNKYTSVKNTDESVDLEPTKKTIFTPACFKTSLFTTILISSYFIPSIGLTFYQRWLYQSFRFPLITVLIHMVVKYLFAMIIRIILAKRQGRERIHLKWKEFVVAVAPTGIFSGIDIGLSNWGLELVNISLYTMTKTTTIVFILFFSILFKLEKKSWSLSGIVLMISIGLILFTYKATQFNLLGFTLLILASISSGVRWTCVQLLLQKSKMGMKNPVDMIYFMQPWMIATLLPFAIWIEGTAAIASCQLFGYSNPMTCVSLVLKILLGAVIAFLMEFSEVTVVTYTSSLTLAVAGIFKEVFQLVLAVEWNGDPMSPVNAIGLCVCLCGIVCHVVHKIKHQPVKLPERHYMEDLDGHEIGENLLNGELYVELTSSDDEKSDTDILFDILNRHER